MDGDDGGTKKERREKRQTEDWGADAAMAVTAPGAAATLICFIAGSSESVPIFYIKHFSSKLAQRKWSSLKAPVLTIAQIERNLVSGVIKDWISLYESGKVGKSGKQNCLNRLQMVQLEGPRHLESRL